MPDKDENLRDFDRARRGRHLGEPNKGVSPLEALKNAEDYIGEAEEPIHGAMVLLELDSGRMAIFSADITLESAVTLLEKTKLTLLLDGGK